MNMREFIDAIGSQKTLKESTQPVMELDTTNMTDDQQDSDVPAPTSDVDATDSDDGLQGMLDPRGLAKLLPDVDKLSFFMSAIRKVQHGDIAMLNMQETRQLAKAFISVLRDDSQTTMKVLSKLKMVHDTDTDTGM